MDRCRFIVALAFTFGLLHAEQAWQPDTDWSHWRLGHRTDLEWLQTNRLTITFGSGAPNFESVPRAEFDRQMEQAKAFNRSYHERGYIVLRYLSSSLSGDSESPEAAPRKEQIGAFRFYNESWDEYQDYIGPKPKQDPRNWITVRPDGTFPFYRYAPYGKTPGRGFETWGCPNNPDYARMMEGRIRAQAETGIDGSYVDWTQIAGGTCYCEHCRRNFIAYLEERLPREAAKAKYGVAEYRDVRPPEKRGEPFWMEWTAFRAHTVAEFHRRLRTVARKYNPHFMISGNVFGGFGYGPIAYDAAGDVELLGREGYDDFVYSEIQEFLDSAPRRTAEGVKVTNSPALKYLAAVTHGKPVIVYATEITPPIFPNPTEKCLSAMAQINIAEAAANHTVFREKRETPAGATRMYQFLATNEPRLRTANLHANVAVLASVQQYLADELSFAFSTSRVLADRGIAHVMAPLDDAAGGLEDYGVVVVPYLPLLSRTRQEALLGYARKGGRLLVLGASGVKDEYNVPQKDVPLARALGANAYPAKPRVRKLGRGGDPLPPAAHSRHSLPDFDEGQGRLHDVRPDHGGPVRRHSGRLHAQPHRPGAAPDSRRRGGRGRRGAGRPAHAPGAALALRRDDVDAHPREGENAGPPGELRRDGGWRHHARAERGGGSGAAARERRSAASSTAERSARSIPCPLCARARAGRSASQPRSSAFTAWRLWSSNRRRSDGETHVSANGGPGRGRVYTGAQLGTPRLGRRP